MDSNNFYDINAPNPFSNYVFDINGDGNYYDNQNNNQIPSKEIINKNNILNINNNDNNFLQQNNNNLNINNNKYKEDDFLKFQDWEYLNDNNIFLVEKKIETIIKNINQNELKNLQKSILEANFNYVFQYPENIQTISPISEVGNLVESSFAYDISFKEDSDSQLENI